MLFANDTEALSLSQLLVGSELMFSGSVVLLILVGATLLLFRKTRK